MQSKWHYLFLSTRIGTIAVLLCLLIACSKRNMEPDKVLVLPIDQTKTDQQLNLQAEGVCAGPLGHDGEIRLRWVSTPDQIRYQRIDLSVHKNGFTDGRFITVFPGTEKAEGVPSKLTDPKFNGQVEILPALEKLRLKSLGPDDQEQKGEANAPSKTIMAVFQSFEPGLNYFIRVLTLEKGKWISGAVVRVEAPVCPKDEFLENDK